MVLKPAQEVGSDSLQTPHDPSVTYSGHKGKGYEGQVAETCTAGNPVQMITHVQVTPSCQSDYQHTVPALQELKDRELLPKEMVTDTNYGGGENAAAAAEMGVNLLCPAPGPSKPKQAVSYDKPTEPCPREAQAATQWLTAREAQPEFQEQYAIRAGSEATNSELHRGHGTKKLRVRTDKRVKLALCLKAAACNVKRALRYWLQQLLQAATGSGPPQAAPMGATAVGALAAP